MYIKKNNAFSLLEIIITISICLILSSILFQLIFSVNKSYFKIVTSLKKEKQIETFKNILSSHLENNKSVELKILNIKSEKNVPSFEEIFKNNNLIESGNFLIVKFSKLHDIKNKIIEINYRTFLFEDKKLKIGYFLEGDFETYGNFSSQTKIIDNCYGNFNLKSHLLKVFLKKLDNKNKKDKYYEFSIYF